MTAKTYIADIRQFLEFDANGVEDRIPAGLPTPALKLALFWGAIISWMSSREIRGTEITNVVCRHSITKRRCFGMIEAENEPIDEHHHY